MYFCSVMLLTQGNEECLGDSNGVKLILETKVCLCVFEYVSVFVRETGGRQTQNILKKAAPQRWKQNVIWSYTVWSINIRFALVFALTCTEQHNLLHKDTDGVVDVNSAPPF